MDLIFLKLLLLIAMIIITFAVGMLPVRLLKLLRKSAACAETSTKHKNLSLILCLLTCFSGGVFFATCFLHLFPELSEHLDHMKHEYDLNVSYPLAELLACLGFFVLFFIEESVLLFLPGHSHTHNINRLSSSSNEANAENGNEHLTIEGNDHYSERSISSSNQGISSLTNRNNGESMNCGLLGSGNRSSINAQCTEISLDPCRRSSSRTKNAIKLLPDTNNFGNNYGALSCPLHSFRSCIEEKRSEVMSVAEPEACETNCETIKEDPPILMNSRPHAHSHGVRSITFVIALSFHSVIEGLAFGVQEDATEVSTLFISLIVHKLVVAFSVGLQLARTHAHALGWVCASIFFFSLTTPLGGVIGMFVQNSQMDSRVKDYIILVFQGLAVGTFIYVTFFEVLLHERDNEHPNLLKILFMFIGFLLIGLLRLLGGHSHGHTHTQENNRLVA